MNNINQLIAQIIQLYFSCLICLYCQKFRELTSKETLLKLHGDKRIRLSSANTHSYDKGNSKWVGIFTFSCDVNPSCIIYFIKYDFMNYLYFYVWCININVIIFDSIIIIYSAWLNDAYFIRNMTNNIKTVYRFNSAYYINLYMHIHRE